MRRVVASLAIITATALGTTSCSGHGTPGPTPTANTPTTPTTTEVEKLEASEVPLEPSESTDAVVEDIDFDAIDDSDTALWSLLLRVEESQGATRTALLSQAEDDLNALADMTLSAIDISVANLDFEQLDDADTAVWSLLLRAEEAREFFDVTSVAERVIQRLDQAGATLVTTGATSYPADVDWAIWSLNLRLDEAEDLVSPTPQK